MLTRFSHLITRLPEPVRHLYGPLLLLAASVTGLVFLDGKCVNAYYLGFYGGFTNGISGGSEVANVDLDSGTFIGRVGAFGATLLANPWQGLCLLGVLISCNQIHYRYFFHRLLSNSTWQGWLGYAVALLVVAETMSNYATRWLGKDNRLARDMVLWAVIIWVVHGTWRYFRETRKARRALTEQATQAELAALKAQINPHFLFNSLNNIFGTALTEGGQRTPDGVQQLARLMRYQLEQTNVEHVDLQTETGFLAEYVQFHRQLLPNAALTHRFEWDEQPITIPPLLLTPLVDYALQHQRATGQPVHSQLSVKKQFLHYQLTYPANADLPGSDALANVEQRLTRLYPYLYTLTERTGDQVNTLSLTINL